MKKIPVTLLLIAFLFPVTALASGGGGGGGGGGGFGGGFRGGGGSTRTIDREKMSLGRKVFYGSAKMPEKIISRDLYNRQGRALVQMQKKIARSKLASSAQSFKPREIAGRMSAKQFSALRYYIRNTYKR